MKEKKEKGVRRLSHRIHVRLTQQKYEELSALLAKTRGINSLSELVRKILEERRIAVKNYDAGVQMIVEELAAIRKEILVIGRNISKATAILHQEQLPGSGITEALELTRLQQQTDLKVTRLFELMAKFSGQWLPR